MASTTGTPTRSQAAAPQRVLQITATLAVINLVWQYVTAGTLFGEGGLEDLHAAGAIALHVTTGLTAIAAFLHHRRGPAPLWPTVLAAVVFVLSFVQAYYGGYRTLAVHVPGAIVLTIGSVWVLAWAFTTTAHRGDTGHPVSGTSPTTSEPTAV